MSLTCLEQVILQEQGETWICEFPYQTILRVRFVFIVYNGNFPKISGIWIWWYIMMLMNWRNKTIHFMDMHIPPPKINPYSPKKKSEKKKPYIKMTPFQHAEPIKMTPFLNTTRRVWVEGGGEKRKIFLDSWEKKWNERSKISAPTNNPACESIEFQGVYLNTHTNSWLHSHQNGNEPAELTLFTNKKE